MRRRLLTLFVLFLAVSMTPGAVELLENVAHAVTHGDAAHADDAGHSERSSKDEHGCSGAVHTCRCCHSAHYVASEGTTLLVTRTSRARRHLAPTAPPCDPPPLRVFRPPRF